MNQINSKINYDIDEVANKILQDKKSMVKIAEKNYRKGVELIAKEVASQMPNKNLLLICGPSSSGKTTTSSILLNALSKLGISALVVSMDNFFINREDTPFLPNGARDYDNVTTVNLDLFKKCMNELLQTKKTKLPIFDFITGVRQDDVVEAKITDKTVIIVEGLHAFNPLCISDVMNKRAIKIFVCPESGFSKNFNSLISAQTLRFTRRLIRDFCSRGHGPKDTKFYWQNVLDSEKKFVLPFKKYADFVIDTTHAYEPFLYNKKMLEISAQDKEFKKFIFPQVPETGLDYTDISALSLIWEFLGA